MMEYDEIIKTQQINVPKATLYRFSELSNEAKLVAINQVFEIERERPNNFYLAYENAHEQMKEILIEADLDVEEDISWEYRHDVLNIDFHPNVSITKNFIKRHLSEDEYTIFSEIEEITNDNVEKYFYNEERVTFGLSDFYHLDEERALRFLAFYSDDEDILVKYKLPALYLENGSDDLNYDELEDLHYDFEILAERYLELFEERIFVHAAVLVEQCKKVVTDLESYLGSEAYYKAKLESEAYEEQIYRFNQAGYVITREEVFIESEQENQYEKYQEK